MHFKIPDKVRLCGIDHPVRRSEDYLRQHSLRGQADYAHRTITIATDMSPDQARRTFLHETLHQIDDLFKLNLSESQNGRLATGIAELISQLEEDDASTSH